MRNQPVLILPPLVWLLFSQFLLAQANFSLPVVNNVRRTAGVDMPVRVSNFKDVISIQFVIRWDPAVLRFEQVNVGQLLGVDVKNSFGTTDAVEKGTLRFNWSNISGASLPDQSTIFSLRFSAIGPFESSSPLVFTEITPGISFEVVLKGNVFYNLQQSRPYLRDGAVAIGFTLPTRESLDVSPQVVAAPNPFHTQTRIDISAANGAEFTELRLYNSAGNLCTARKISLAERQNGIVIDNSDCKQPGLYFLHLQSKTYSAVKSLFYF